MIRLTIEFEQSDTVAESDALVEALTGNDNDVILAAERAMSDALGVKVEIDLGVCLNTMGLGVRRQDAALRADTDGALGGP